MPRSENLYDLQKSAKELYDLFALYHPRPKSPEYHELPPQVQTAWECMIRDSSEIPNEAELRDEIHDELKTNYTPTEFAMRVKFPDRLVTEEKEEYNPAWSDCKDKTVRKKIPPKIKVQVPVADRFTLTVKAPPVLLPPGTRDKLKEVWHLLADIAVASSGNNLPRLNEAQAVLDKLIEPDEVDEWPILQTWKAEFVDEQIADGSPYVFEPDVVTQPTPTDYVGGRATGIVLRDVFDAMDLHPRLEIDIDGLDKRYTDADGDVTFDEDAICTMASLPDPRTGAKS